MVVDIELMGSRRVGAEIEGRVALEKPNMGTSHRSCIPDVMDTGTPSPFSDTIDRSA